MIHSPADDDAKPVSQWFQMYDTVITVYRGRVWHARSQEMTEGFFDLKP